MLTKSDLVFAASKTVGNRYQLCRVAARIVRTLHFASNTTHDAITDALVRIGGDAYPQIYADPGLWERLDAADERHS